jgi:hypothetical protein
MANKTFEIKGKVSFDDQDFNRQIDAMQKKLKEIYAPGDMARAQNASNARMTSAGLGGGFQPINPGNSVNAKREADQLLMSLNRTQDAKARQIDKELKGLDAMGKLLKDNNNLSQEQVRILEAQFAAREKIANQFKQEWISGNQAQTSMLNERQSRETKADRILSGRGYALPDAGIEEGPNGPTPPPGGGGFNKGAAAFVKGGVEAVKALGPVVAGIMATVISGTAMASSYANAPISTEQAQGSAIQNVFGKQLGSLAQGNAIENTAFNPERIEATKMAQEKFKTFGNIPLSLSQLYHKAGGALGSERMANQFAAEKQQEYGEDFQKALEAKIAENPMKYEAAQRFQKNNQRDLGMQRQLGLNFNTYHGAGGYLESANTGGFNENQSIAMSQGIMGSGGSTRMGRETAGGLQLQSGMNLTNISSILGKISGQTGNAALAQQITEKMLEEAVARGFNKSEFTEEFRKFADITGTIVANNGAQSPQDAARLAQGFGRFVGDEKTPGALTGAQSAYEEFQNQSSATSGRGGALQYAMLMRNKGTGGLDPNTLGGLMEMKEGGLNPNDPLMKSAADTAGNTPQEMVKIVGKIKRQLPAVMAGVSQKAIDDYTDYFKEHNLDEATVDLSTIDPKIKATYKQLSLIGPKIGEEGGTQKSLARMRGYRGIEDTGAGAAGEPSNPIANMKRDITPGETIAAAKAAAKEGGTARPEDANERAIGALNQKFLQNFRDYVTVITPAADALAQFTANMIAFLKASGKSVPGSAPTQSQAGNSGGGKK